MTRAPRSGFATAALLCAGLALPVTAEAGSKHAWDNLSTGLVMGLGGAALATTVAKHDRKGGKQMLLGLGVTLLATEALKAAVDEERPDGSGHDSFPSGHTAVAFAAATYLSVRYGDQYRALPPIAYGAAVLTGVARVQADKHYARDVIAGAALGLGVAYMFTTSQQSELSVMPTRDGATVSYTVHF